MENDDETIQEKEKYEENTQYHRLLQDPFITLFTHCNVGMSRLYYLSNMVEIGGVHPEIWGST